MFTKQNYLCDFKPCSCYPQLQTAVFGGQAAHCMHALGDAVPNTAGNHEMPTPSTVLAPNLLS